MTQYIDNYKYVDSITRDLVSELELNNLIPPGFDLVEILIYKVGGYNCSIEGVFKHMEARDLHSFAYQMPVLSGLLAKRYIKSEEYEVDLVELCASSHLSPVPHSEIYYFASTENYLPVLLAHADLEHSTNSPVFILPDSAKDWATYKTLLQRDYEIYFLSSMYAVSYTHLRAHET